MRKKIKRKSRKTYKRKKKTSNVRQSIFNFLKLILLIGAVGFIVYYFVFRTSGVEEPASISQKKEKVKVSSLSKPEAVDYSLKQIFSKYELLDSWITTQNNVIKVQIPQDIQFIVLVHEIITEIEKMGCEVTDCKEDLTAQKSTVEISYKDKLVRKVVLSQASDLKRTQGKIAIIIDDFGYSKSQQIQQILQFPFPVTIAIIPGLSKSKQLYELAHQHTKETLIHLPMEALDEKVDYTNYTLYTTNMTDAEIRQRVQNVIEDYPKSKGINNHMGSKATANSRIMKILMEVLKKQHRFFIDSKTTNKSVAYQTAQNLNVLSAERDIFLDSGGEDDEEYLKNKLAALKKIVKKKGTAIAIGHPYKNTVKVLSEEIPKLQKEGYDFVTLTELVK